MNGCNATSSGARDAEGTKSCASCGMGGDDDTGVMLKHCTACKLSMRGIAMPPAREPIGRCTSRSAS